MFSCNFVRINRSNNVAIDIPDGASEEEEEEKNNECCCFTWHHHRQIKERETIMTNPTTMPQGLSI
jgi:hypothetical protein